MCVSTYDSNKTSSNIYKIASTRCRNTDNHENYRNNSSNKAL